MAVALTEIEKLSPPLLPARYGRSEMTSKLFRATNRQWCSLILYTHSECRYKERILEVQPEGAASNRDGCVCIVDQKRELTCGAQAHGA